MESDAIVAVVTLVLSLLSAFLGVKYRKWLARGRLFVELLDSVIDAAEDDEVSEEEFQEIVAKAKMVAAEVED